MPDGHQFTLVCGGGGVWGVAWMTGIAMGLADHGIDLRCAGVFVGTSAGSVLGAQLACAADPSKLFARQTKISEQPAEAVPVGKGMSELMRFIQRPFRDAEERRAAMCTFALETATMSSSDRRVQIAERLGVAGDRWPTKPLSITAVNAETAAGKVFTAGSGVTIIDAVAASCAVPGVWPPALINGERFIDGGCWRTSDNAHLAAGAERVLILSPMSRSAENTPEQAAMLSDIENLRRSGSQVVVIVPDGSAIGAMALGPLHPDCRKPAAEAGRLQGSREVSAIAKLVLD